MAASIADRGCGVALHSRSRNLIMQGKVTLKSISSMGIQYLLLYGLTFISLSHLLLHLIRNALTPYCVRLVAPPTLILSMDI